MCKVLGVLVDVFLFQKKTAYDMRISDWSSDVCSSDLLVRQSTYMSEALRAYQHCIGIVLRKQGNVFRQGCLGAIIPMIKVSVRDDHRINARQDIVDGHGQIHQGIAQLTTVGTFNAWVRAFL